MRQKQAENANNSRRTLFKERLKEGLTLTIEEYLHQYEHLKRCAEIAYKRLCDAEDRATNIRCGLNIDGTPRAKGGRPSGHETALIEAADALKMCNKADKAFKDYEKQLKGALNSLFYWEGRLLAQIYINNVIFNRPPYDDVDYVLQDMEKRPAKEYIHIAQEHLAEILKAQGVELTA